MAEKVFYGIWYVPTNKPAYWIRLNKDTGLFTEYLPIARGILHNITVNLALDCDDVRYQIRQLGKSGLPVKRGD